MTNNVIVIDAIITHNDWTYYLKKDFLTGICTSYKSTVNNGVEEIIVLSQDKDEKTCRDAIDSNIGRMRMFDRLG